MSWMRRGLRESEELGEAVESGSVPARSRSLMRTGDEGLFRCRFE